MKGAQREPNSDVLASVDALAKVVAGLADRLAIENCIRRYTRGVDRMDRELLLSAYHDDGMDYHGPINSTPAAFADWYWDQQPDRAMTQHHISNQTIDINGDEAHAETYYFAVTKPIAGDEMVLALGRYIDRLERRDDEWAIVTRVVARATMFDVVSISHDGTPGYEPTGTRDRSDYSYQRPLRRTAVD